MAEQRFSIQQLAEMTGCSWVGDPNHIICGVADLDMAEQTDASFFANRRYQHAFERSQAGVIFVDCDTSLLEGRNYLIATSPSEAFQRLLDQLYGVRLHPSGFRGIHPSAVIHPSAHIGEGVTIGPHAVVDEEVVIEAHAFIGAGCYIGPQTLVGMQSTIHPHVIIREGCKIGHRVIIQPGAVIGSCGFGYHTDAQGKHVKLNQLGSVHIEDDVEIGANTTIDRARFKVTRIGKGTKLDNLIQIGHGVQVGTHSLMAAQTGIAGSTEIGHHVVLAGQVAVAGHLVLADGVIVAGKSGVSKSLKTAGKYMGIPAEPLQAHHRRHVYLKHIEKYIAQWESLSLRVARLEEKEQP